MALKGLLSPACAVPGAGANVEPLWHVLLLVHSGFNNKMNKWVEL